MGFASDYAALEEKFKEQAEKDGDLYVPNIRLSGPVDFVFVAMEPSMRWASRSGDGAQRALDNGFKGFTYSFEDFILHYCIRTYLRRNGETYHVTDVSKGAMLVKHANVDRKTRFGRWCPLLKKELKLVAKPRAEIFAMGREARDFLDKSGISSVRIPHYSGQNAAERNRSVLGKKPEFELLAATLGCDAINRVARDVMAEAGFSDVLAKETTDRLARGSRLTSSRKKLIFAYKTGFDKCS